MGFRVPQVVRRPGPMLPVLAILLSATVVGCVQRTRIEAAGTVAVESPKLNPFSFYEEGAVLFIAVDGRAAQYVKDGRIFPLGLGLANHSRGTLTFDPESFALETSDGNRYPLVSFEEYNRDYKQSATDARLADTFIEAMDERHKNYRHVQWRLFPFRGELSVAKRSVELGTTFWTWTYLYFPIPEKGIHGQSFSLLVKPKELPQTFVVRFTLR